MISAQEARKLSEDSLVTLLNFGYIESKIKTAAINQECSISINLKDYPSRQKALVYLQIEKTFKALGYNVSLDEHTSCDPREPTPSTAHAVISWK